MIMMIGFLSSKLSGKLLTEVISFSGTYDLDFKVNRYIRGKSTIQTYTQKEIHPSFLTSTKNKILQQFFEKQNYGQNIKCLADLPFLSAIRSSKRQKTSTKSYKNIYTNDNDNKNNVNADSHLKHKSVSKKAKSNNQKKRKKNPKKRKTRKIADKEFLHTILNINYKMDDDFAFRSVQPLTQQIKGDKLRKYPLKEVVNIIKKDSTRQIKKSQLQYINVYTFS